MSLGMYDVWINQDFIIPDYIFIKQRLIDQFKQTWRSNIDRSDKLVLFKSFKIDFDFDRYLDLIQVDKYRIMLTRLKLSSHNLAIETGRYHNVPQNMRLCQYCNMNVIENEYHFLLVCPLYRDLRKQLFKKYYCHWPNIHKLNSLLSQTSQTGLTKLGKYIFLAFKF